MIEIQPSIEIKESHYLKMWIILDNPGGWCLYTFRPMFEQRGGKYICHAMPAGAVPVPINAVTGKREAGGYEFFYQGWKQENPTRKNCRFDATREDLFPTCRDSKLDVTFLKKMGLSKQRMGQCNALFFYQLLLPIVDPAMSGINGDTRMGYYEDVARNTNMYAFGVKNRGGTCGLSFVQPLLRSYLSGMALCVTTSTQTLLSHG
jgi:hypothetical protein